VRNASPCDSFPPLAILGVIIREIARVWADTAPAASAVDGGQAAPATWAARLFMTQTV